MNQGKIVAAVRIGHTKAFDHTLLMNKLYGIKGNETGMFWYKVVDRDSSEWCSGQRS